MFNVLIVDDEPRVVDALIKNVNWEECGVSQVYKAESCRAALQLLDTEKVDVLISDIEMPNGSGFQLLEELRSHNNDIPCIYVTCHPEFEYMRSAIQVRCYDYILKPIDYEEFALVLCRLKKQMQKDEKVSVMLPPEEKPKPDREQKIAQSVMDYIQSHMTENITVSGIAAELHFNPQYLMRVFKKKTGFSIVEFITSTRMETAKTLLSTTQLSIREISSHAGYGDYAYFTRVFRKETGLSPSQYRRKFK